MTTARTTEPQQSLFSWAEFMAGEAVKPKRRNGPDPSPYPSMFEWAVERETGGGDGRRGRLDRTSNKRGRRTRSSGLFH